MTRHLIALVLSTIALSAPALASEFQPVREKSVFLSLLNGRALKLDILALTLNVTPDGRISGQAKGKPVTGSWSWKEGYFCRQMEWGKVDIPYNCQLVEARDDAQVRFTVDRGAGQSAKFRLE